MLRRVDTSSRPVWDRLVQAYEFEFSRITGKTPAPDGTMPLDTVLGEGISGWIFWQEGRPAGFAAVVDHGEVREVAEFYVVPAYRGRGLGRNLASALFDRTPGCWVVKQLVEATEAQAFWRKVLSGLPCQDLGEESFVDPKWGMVTCQRFVWTSACEGKCPEAGMPRGGTAPDAPLPRR